ncbi:hypothetical protein [Entomospira culicis]|nr:hypothetical protein [Entomospira culicis]WDI37396.1 hypothetical protein PVA46_01005 [Entomospira culicis]
MKTFVRLVTWVAILALLIGSCTTDAKVKRSDINTMKLFMDPMPWSSTFPDRVYYRQKIRELEAMASVRNLDVVFLQSHTHDSYRSMRNTPFVEADTYYVHTHGQAEHRVVFRMARVVVGFSAQEILAIVEQVHPTGLAIDTSSAPAYFKNLAKPRIFTEELPSLHLYANHVVVRDANTGEPILSPNGKLQYSSVNNLRRENQKAGIMRYLVENNTFNLEEKRPIFIEYTWGEY